LPRQSADEVKDGRSQAIIPYRHESLDKLEAFCREHNACRRRMRRFADPCRDNLGGTFVEERRRRVQHPRYLLQAAGPDAVSALFILLHLLERDAQRLSEALLRNA